MNEERAALITIELSEINQSLKKIAQSLNVIKLVATGDPERLARISRMGVTPDPQRDDK